MKKYKIIANWKSFGNIDYILDFLSNINTSFGEKIELIFAPPASFFYLFQNIIKNNNIFLSSQNISYDDNAENSTGELTVKILNNFNVNYCIIGHSERRRYENDQMIYKKINYCLQSNIIPIICIGESEEIKKNNKTFEYFDIQINYINQIISQNEKNIIIAYEPIWSIGTDTLPSNEEILKNIKYIKKKILNSDKISFLYGGSVNQNNINVLLNINLLDGFLLGRSSNNYQSLNQIISIINDKFI